MDTFFSKTEVNNIELFSVEAGRQEYVKQDFLAKTTTTNMPYFADLVNQRKEAFRFMKTINGLYAGGPDFLCETNRFVVSIYTDNAYVPFQVTIRPRLREINALDKSFKTIFFKAQPAPGFSGKGRELFVWAVPFPYMAEAMADPALIWLSGNTFEMAMIPIMAEYGLKVGAVRCVLFEMKQSEFRSHTDLQSK